MPRQHKKQKSVPSEPPKQSSLPGSWFFLSKPASGWTLSERESVLCSLDTGVSWGSLFPPPFHCKGRIWLAFLREGITGEKCLLTTRLCFQPAGSVPLPAVPNTRSLTHSQCVCSPGGSAGATADSVSCSVISLGLSYPPRPLCACEVNCSTASL